MRYLLLPIILLCSLAGSAQDAKLAANQPAAATYIPDLLHMPATAIDSQATTSLHRHLRRPRGTIALGIGVALFAISYGTSHNGDHPPSPWLGSSLGFPALIFTVAGGLVMIGDLSKNGAYRYSVILHPTGLGLAYNF